MCEFNHQQDDTGTFAIVIAFIGLILLVGSIAAMAWLFQPS